MILRLERGMCCNSVIGLVWFKRDGGLAFSIIDS